MSHAIETGRAAYDRLDERGRRAAGPLLRRRGRVLPPRSAGLRRRRGGLAHRTGTAERAGARRRHGQAHRRPGGAGPRRPRHRPRPRDARHPRPRGARRPHLLHRRRGDPGRRRLLRRGGGGAVLPLVRRRRRPGRDRAGAQARRAPRAGVEPARRADPVGAQARPDHRQRGERRRDAVAARLRPVRGRRGGHVHAVAGRRPTLDPGPHAVALPHRGDGRSRSGSGGSRTSWPSTTTTAADPTACSCPTAPPASEPGSRRSPSSPSRARPIDVDPLTDSASTLPRVVLGDVTDDDAVLLIDFR